MQTEGEIVVGFLPSREWGNIGKVNVLWKQVAEWEIHTGDV